MQKRPQSRAPWNKPRIPSAFASLALAVVLLGGCKKEPERATVLAQVGDATLTLEDLRESFPPEFEQLVRREQYLDFIKRWMDDEVVYQQALKAKLETDSSVVRRLEKLKRKLLIEEFLARENAAEVFEPDEMAMNQYYEMHKEDFRRKVPEVKYVQIRVQTGKQASDLRSKAVRGDFLTVAEANSLDPVPESYASIVFKKQTEFPACLSQDIASASIGNVTLPIACPDGFYLIKVLERQDAGSLIPFAEAREEISGLLVMERKDKLLDGRIAKYKEGIPVSYNLDQIPGLTESAKGPEPTAAASQATAAPQPSAAPEPMPPAKARHSRSRRSPIPSATPSDGSAATPAKAPPAAARLPREPSAVPLSGPSSRSAPVQTAPGQGAATDPRLPREPWQDPQNAAPAARQKGSQRKRAVRHAPADTSESRQTPGPDAGALPETSNPTPDAGENSNAQSPTQTP